MRPGVSADTGACLWTSAPQNSGLCPRFLQLENVTGTSTYSKTVTLEKGHTYPVIFQEKKIIRFECVKEKLL